MFCNLDNIICNNAFQVQKDRIFHAGVSLRRIRDSSDATIIVDNDALLHNNPELSPSDCYVITNNAVLDVINSLSQDYISPDFNLLCASKQGQSTVEYISERLNRHLV